MLSYITKKVNKAYKASKKALTTNPAYKETAQYKLIRCLQKNQSQILSNDKLTELALMTYQSQKFYLIFDILMLRMNSNNQIFDFQSTKGLKQLRNCFVVCGYLVRNGASGFIDQFRDGIEEIKKLGWHLQSLMYKDQQNKSEKYKSMLNQVSSRIKHFVQLLEDNKKLLKQKQISMLIKKKLKINQKQNERKMSNTEQKPEKQKKQKNIDNFLNNYLWKYVSIIDDKIDFVAEVLADKLQKYLLEEQPESFSIDELQVNQQVKIKSEANFSDKKIQQEQQFLQKKLKMRKEVKNEDLLQ